VNLPEALEQALTARYPAKTIASPPTSSRGFQARLRALEKAGKGEKGAAELVGVTLRTWRGWKAGKKPSKRSLAALEGAHESQAAARARRAAERSVKRSGSQWVSVRITADIWWHDDEDYSRGVRTTRLDPIDISGVIAAWTINDHPAMESAFNAAVEDTYGYSVTFHGDVNLDW
jgi:hypothetical protein